MDYDETVDQLEQLKEDYEELLEQVNQQEGLPTGIFVDGRAVVDLSWWSAYGNAINTSTKVEVTSLAMAKSTGRLQAITPPKADTGSVSRART